MKIGYFIGHFPYMDKINDPDYTKKYAHGGTEIAAYNLAVKMSDRKNEVNVFTTSIDSRDLIENVHGMNIYRYGTSFKVASANVALKLLYKPLKHDLDIVHSHSPIPYSDIPAMLYSRNNKVPFVLTYQYDAQENIGGFIRNLGVTSYNRLLLNKVLDHADVIIATTSAYLKSSPFIKNHKDKAIIIPNGIDLDEFNLIYSKDECREKLNLSPEKKIILFFGSLVKYKGPDVLLKAFSIVLKEVPDAELIFAGRGEMKDYLLKLANELNIKDYVKFIGFVDENKKPLYYKAVDIFCLPSTNMGESFGIVNLEAMASGVPVISSNLGGIPDIINDGENGLLVDPGDFKSLANSIIYLLQNEDIKNEMGACGKRKSREYSWDKIAVKTEEVYKSLLDRV